MKRHIILTLGRSGSNALVNLLNQHPEVLNVGEVLGDWNRARKIANASGLYKDNPDAYLDAMSSPSWLVQALCLGRNSGRLLKLKPHEVKRLSQTETLGFKEFATHFAQQGQRNWLTSRPDITVIGLVRNDILGRYVSWQRLEQTGVVLQSGPQAARRTQITLDPTKIENHLNKISAENALLQAMLDELPAERKCVLNYEEVFSGEISRNKLMERVFLTLGVKPWPTEIKMSKIVQQPPAEIIANRAECADALKGTAFEGILDPS